VRKGDRVRDNSTRSAPRAGDCNGPGYENRDPSPTVCEGLEAEAVEIRRLARATNGMTVGTSEASVRKGMSVGVFSERNRYRLVVNLGAMKEEGVALSAQLLRLATVIPERKRAPSAAK
jgi:hypothetical protein